jgi:hypothetical protein
VDFSLVSGGIGPILRGSVARCAPRDAVVPTKLTIEELARGAEKFPSLGHSSSLPFSEGGKDPRKLG